MRDCCTSPGVGDGIAVACSVREEEWPASVLRAWCVSPYNLTRETLHRRGGPWRNRAV